MRKTTPTNTHKIKPLLFLFLLVAFMGNAQIMQVKIEGAATPISSNDVITIEAGKSVQFKITNIETLNCSSINIRNVKLSGSSGSSSFSISLPETFGNILRVGCNNQIATYLDFTVTRDDLLCTEEEVTITIIYNVFEEFTFKLRVKKSPIISVLGGSPPADIIDGTTTTTATNGTFFGIVEQGASVTRRFYVVNTGSCPLVLNSISSSIQSPNTISNFTIITATSPSPPYVYPIPPGEAFWFDVTFNAPPAATGLYMETINIINNTSAPTNLFTFNVSAEIYDFNPGPGGVRADFRLWLKSTRGVIASPTTPSYVSIWRDLGTNGKSATQPVAANQPTYLDNMDSNINFNPVIKFKNDVGSLEQYLYNETNGFYSQDIFIVMIPDPTIDNLSNQNAIFAGVKSNLNSPTPVGTITGIGMGKYTDSFDNEVITYMQESSADYGIAEISTTKTYNNAGIINVRNNDIIPTTAQELLYNSNLIATSTINPGFMNVGNTELDSDNNTVILGTKYWIGKNFSEQGSLNGRVAEIMTFAQRVPDEDRPKIETYLAIKYGITLGATTAEKNYVNSAGTVIWEISADTEYNHNVAGIGRDDNSDLNQKQSKSINETNEVTIGLGGIYSKNSENTNEFKKDGDFLVWGCDNGVFTGSNTNEVTIATDITTSLTRIDRKWKIVESKVALDGDVENVFVSIPSTAFSAFTKTTEEEFVLIVSETEGFASADIVDVIPMKKLGSNHQTWYDFDETKYFTFGKAPKLAEKSAVNIAAGDYLVGEYALNLNINAFTISAWIKGVPSSAGADPRTIMAKGSKLQLRLNSDNKIEVVLEDVIIFTSTPEMALDDSKWHNITFVYASGTVFLYIDGILDKSVQSVEPPTPNYNHFSLGAVYISKGSGIINPFLGEIDEVYVWDQGLTQDQIRYLMNQEIERFAVSGTDYANGKVLPQAATSNEVTTIPWSKLRAYYDFNSFYGSTVEGQDNNRNFLRIKYLNKTKTIIDTQSAPLPYVSAADGDWDTPATWLNNTVQNLPNSLGLDGVTKVDWNIVETSHNISSTGNKTLLGLMVNSNTITASNDTKIEVSHYLKLNGNIDLQGMSQLVQTLNSVLESTSAGAIKRNQQGVGNKYSYNYWSSPVGPINAVTNNNNYTVAGVFKDGTTLTPKNITWIVGYDGNSTSDPISLARYWLYKFSNGTGYGNWAKINENNALVPSQGFTAKGTNSVGSAVQNYTFVGKPNNGSIDLTSVLADNYFLVGNPYPSALDGSKFIADNIETITGTIYFWEQSSENNTHYLAGYTGGYSTLNNVGGVGPIVPAGISGLGLSSKVPKQYIPVGQGFFVIGKNGMIVAQPIVFNNGQRGFQKEDSNDSTTLFKNGATTKGKTQTDHFNDNSNDPIKDEKLIKIRLGFNTADKFHRQLLLGFMNEKATDGEDYGYDAKQIEIRANDMYFPINNSKFNIQGVGYFDVNKIYPLAISAPIGGNVQFVLDEALNLPSHVSICIFDKFTGETHNISQKPFEINLEPETYLDRFALTFNMQKLVAEDVTAELIIPAASQPIIEGIHVVMNNTIGELQIKNNSSEEILSVALINSLGQTVKTWNSNFKIRTISLPISTATGIYNVQITTKNGTTVKKIIIE